MGSRLSQFGSSACGLTPPHCATPGNVWVELLEPQSPVTTSLVTLPLRHCLFNENAAAGAGPRMGQDSRGYFHVILSLFLKHPCECVKRCHYYSCFTDGETEARFRFPPRCWHCGLLTPVLLRLSCICVTPNGRGWVGLSSRPDAQSWRPCSGLFIIWGLAAQHRSLRPGFGEMPTMWVLMNPAPLYRRQRPKHVFSEHPQSCQPVRWSRLGHKSGWGTETGRSSSNSILSPGWWHQGSWVLDVCGWSWEFRGPKTSNQPGRHQTTPLGWPVCASAHQHPLQSILRATFLQYTPFL